MQKRIFYLKDQPFVLLSANGRGGKDATEEATLALTRIKTELEGLGASLDDMVRTTYFFRNQECRPQITEVRKKFLRQATRPASSSLVLRDLHPDDTLVEIEATAIVGKSRGASLEGVEFDPARPYLKAIRVGTFLFLSGVGGRGKEIKAQAKSAFDAIDKTLTELGSGKDRMLQLSCYLKDKSWNDSVRGTALEWIARHNRTPRMEFALVDGFANEEMLLEVEATAFS